MTITTETVRCNEPEKALRSARALAPGDRHACTFAPFPNAAVERPSPEPMPAELQDLFGCSVTISEVAGYGTPPVREKKSSH